MPSSSQVRPAGEIAIAYRHLVDALSGIGVPVPGGSAALCLDIEKVRPILVAADVDDLVVSRSAVANASQVWRERRYVAVCPIAAVRNSVGIG